MINFVHYTPTEVVFGKDTELQAGAYAKKWGASRVLLVFGKGSAVRSGLVGRVEDSLAKEGIASLQFGGVQANPLLSYAEVGIREALDFGADMILAVGGGSVIDTAKAIAHGAANPDLKLWDIWTRKVEITKTLPVGVVLTIPAAGSEMSNSAVLTNEAEGRKAGLNFDLNRVKFAIMNPALAATLPKYQLGCGVTDIMMHTLERYFIPDSHAMITDEIAEGLLRTVIANGRIIAEHPEDYDAMAEIMWCSSISHNGMTELGRRKDFCVHKFGHALSARYNAAHGASLAAVWGAWAKSVYKLAVPRFAQYARKVWNITEHNDEKAALKGIEATISYFHEIGMPTSLKELGLSPSDQEFRDLALNATMNGTITICVITPIDDKKAEEIFRAAAE